jgi:UDP-glucuronate 4-epimerase
MYEIINLGNSRTVSLGELVQSLEDVLGAEAGMDRHPAQLGDVPQTYADTTKAGALLGFEPQIELRDGLRMFVEWLRNTDPGI